MSQYGLISCINIFNIIRIFNNAKSCIDHIFMKNINSNTAKFYIIKCDKTDHYSTVLIINIQTSYSGKINDITISPEIIHKIDYNHLNMLLKTNN